MNYYELEVKFKRRDGVLWSTDSMLPFPDKMVENEKKFYKDICRQLNEHFDMDTERKTNVYAYYAAEGIVKFIYEADLDEIKRGKIRKEIRESFEDRYGQVDITISKPKEITGEIYFKLGNTAAENDYIDNFDDDKIELFRDDDHYVFELKEVLLPNKKVSKAQVLKEAEAILADTSFLYELDRIYSSENVKRYYGNPVHYLIRVTNKDSSERMIELLGRALLSNNRLLGSRITKMTEIDDSWRYDTDLENTIERSGGNIFVIDLSGTDEDHGNYASSYHIVIDFLCKMFTKYQRNTLFIFVKNTEHPGFADSLLARITEKGKVIELKEGGGDAERIMNYIKTLAKRDNQPVDEDEIKKELSGRKYFKIGEAHEIYDRCFSNALMDKLYKVYKTCTYVKNKEAKTKAGPYEELQNMVGLKEIKRVVDSIISNARIQKIRSSKGMDMHKTSLHMVFTGNPGSAKTTVARLLAEILAKENIIDNANVVECGRADLVGKYVGWTAKTVVSKFKEAVGGILFIDEAYSLVEDHNSFGDEAINTIVQEMENHREDVIVVFAGYPQKMKEFLDKNEGLRSRIAFHLDFPDYNSDELVEILKIMADQKGFTLDQGVIKKCEDIFEGAVKHKDYGNGRFVRNLLEQAMLAQSKRLSDKYKGRKMSRKALNSLIAEDFEVNISKKYADKKINIGFSA